MSRVAIVGSCITRDLWPVRGEGADDLLYISRTSLPSLFAPAVEGFRPRGATPEGLGRHQHGAVTTDLTKTALRRLAAFRPTHLILDFIDERFDLLQAGGAVVAHSWELEASGYLRTRPFKNLRAIPRLSPACDRLWDEGVREFVAFVEATPLARSRLILHSARWAETSRNAGGRLAPVRDVEILPGRPASIEAHNALLASYEARLTDLLPAMTKVEAPALRIADEDHRWGLSPFHYVADYYAEIWRRLAALGVSRPA